jgi:hypothetical protein
VISRKFYSNITATLQKALISDGYPAKEKFLYEEPALNTEETLESLRRIWKTNSSTKNKTNKQTKLKKDQTLIKHIGVDDASCQVR